MTKNIVKKGQVDESKFQEYRKKPIVIQAYPTNEELEIETLEGVMKADVGDYIIRGVHGELYPVKPDIFMESYEVGDTSISDDVMANLHEWTCLITELSKKEIELNNLKGNYQALSDEIIESTDFKALYGKNNAEVRKNHVRNELSDEYESIKELEFSLDYLKRRISFLKQLIHTKTVLIEVKE